MHGMDDRTRRRVMPHRAALAGASLILASACAAAPTLSPAAPVPASTAPPVASAATPGPSAAMAAPSSRTQAVIDYLVSRVAEDPSDPDAQLELGLALLQRVRETADPSLYAPAQAALEAARRLLPKDPSRSSDSVGSSSVDTVRRGPRDGAGSRPARAPSRPVRARSSSMRSSSSAGMTRRSTRPKHLPARPLTSRRSSRVSYARELRGDIDGALDAMRGALRVARARTGEHRLRVVSSSAPLNAAPAIPVAAKSAYEAALQLVPEPRPFARRAWQARHRLR